jgi:flagellar biosynthetic protein FliR
MTEGVTQMFIASLQIAGPLILVLFLADVGLGLLTRIAPALNAFSMGFPLKILITIIFSATAFVLLPGIVSSLMTSGLQMLDGVS